MSIQLFHHHLLKYISFSIELSECLFQNSVVYLWIYFWTLLGDCSNSCFLLTPQCWPFSVFLEQLSVLPEEGEDTFLSVATQVTHHLGSTQWDAWTQSVKHHGCLTLTWNFAGGMCFAVGWVRFIQIWKIWCNTFHFTAIWVREQCWKEICTKAWVSTDYRAAPN